MYYVILRALFMLAKSPLELIRITSALSDRRRETGSTDVDLSRVTRDVVYHIHLNIMDSEHYVYRMRWMNNAEGDER